MIGVSAYVDLHISSLSGLFSSGDFNTNVSWWSFTGVRVIASLLKSPEFFPVIWPILTMF